MGVHHGELHNTTHRKQVLHTRYLGGLLVTRLCACDSKLYNRSRGEFISRPSKANGLLINAEEGLTGKSLVKGFL